MQMKNGRMRGEERSEVDGKEETDKGIQRNKGGGRSQGDGVRRRAVEGS